MHANMETLCFEGLLSLFHVFVSLPLAANWLQLSVASIAHGSHHLAGTLVRGKGAAPDFATHIMLTHPVELTLVWLCCWRCCPRFALYLVLGMCFIA